MPRREIGTVVSERMPDLVNLCDELDYTQVCTAEHYFEPYGGYSP